MQNVVQKIRTKFHAAPTPPHRFYQLGESFLHVVQRAEEIIFFFSSPHRKKGKLVM
jgi:hypothetical protein